MPPSTERWPGHWSTTRRPCPRLALALAPWWRLRSRYTDGYALLQAAAHCPPGGEDWCAAQVWLGLLSLCVGDTVGLDHFTKARDALALKGPSPMLVEALNRRAGTLRNTGRLPESAGEARRALATARDLGDSYGEATALYHLTGAANYAGDHQAMLRWLRQAQQIDPARVPPVVARRHGITLAACLMEMGDLDPARQAGGEVLASAREAGAAELQAECLTVLAELELRAGRVDEAAAPLGEALGLAARAGNVQLSRARRALGPAAAQAAEDRGAAMTLATAIEFAALLVADDPGQPSPAPGAHQLSARERELVTLVAQGRTDAQVAAQLFISVRTVRSHLDRIGDKTGYRRRADLTRLALNVGLV
jgi:DNA-binding CsgD family transcriptional regulator